MSSFSNHAFSVPFIVIGRARDLGTAQVAGMIGIDKKSTHQSKNGDSVVKITESQRGGQESAIVKSRPKKTAKDAMLLSPF